MSKERFLEVYTGYALILSVPCTVVGTNNATIAVNRTGQIDLRNQNQDFNTITAVASGENRPNPTSNGNLPTSNGSSTDPVVLQANILTTEEMEGIKGKGMIYVWRYGKYYTWSHWRYGIYHPIGFSFDGNKIYYFTLKGWHWEYYWGPEYGWYKKKIWYSSHMTLPSNFAGYA